MKTNTKIVGALLLGTAIGGALGILFAPDKGMHTRRKIGSKSSDLTDAMKAKLNLQTIDDLNSRILKITLKINEEYPELYQYIEEMPVTIPDNNHPEITLKNLNTYYESLNTMLKKYMPEHS